MPAAACYFAWGCFRYFGSAHFRGGLSNVTRSRAGKGTVRRYRSVLESWQPIPLDVDIAESAARLRAWLRLKPADAVQAASALAVNAAALVTHDRDFSRVGSLRIIS
jgi:predicted nucleic acid-binding protein